MQRALETTPAWVVLSIIATTPVVVIPFAFVFEGERPNVRSLLGGVVAVVGVIGLAWLKH
jgi:drug/metabolite transporter (DMT)-like permease